MSVSIAKMSIDYYLNSAAVGDGAGRDMTGYYVRTQAPSGRWYGSGLAGLNLEPDSEVTREEAVALYEHQADPLTGQTLGRPLMKKQQTPEGAKTPMGQDSKSEREGVAGFDLTFSPPKSVSSLWALAGPELQSRIEGAHHQALKETLEWVESDVLQTRAGHAGVAHVPVRGMVASLFDHWDSRAGDPHLHTHAVISNKVQRETDGQWVTLDSYTLHRHVVAVSEHYNSLLFDRLHQHIGAMPEARDPHYKAEVEQLLTQPSPDDAAATSSDHSAPNRTELAGVPELLIEEFSTRAAEVAQRKEELVARWKENHGRDPSRAEDLKLQMQAQRETKTPKDEEALLPVKVNRWRQRARSTGIDPDTVVRNATGHPQATITPEMLTSSAVDRVGAWALQDASLRRATFRRANVQASAERVLRLVRCQNADERRVIVEQVTDAALDQAEALTPDRFTAEPALDDPAVINNGRSVFDHKRTSGVYTTRETLDDEAFLIERTQAEDAPTLTDLDDLDEVLSQWRSDGDYPLSEDQHAAAHQVLTSQSGVEAIIGPAGTGKTTTMSAITEAWATKYGDNSVIGLAPSAVAAGVLSDEIGVSTDNVSKWLYESVGEGAARRAQQAQKLYDRLITLDTRLDQATGQNRQRVESQLEATRSRLAQAQADQARYAFREGQLLIIDEASMVSTNQLAELSRQADTAGAKVLLVGDPAQLEAVDAGGFLGYMERNQDPAHLNMVWRFKNDWEKDASLRLRHGDTDVLQVYEDAERLHGDPNIDAADSAYGAWKADHDQGKSSILIASDNTTVQQLDERAHADRVAEGTVTLENGTVRLRNDSEAGEGEIILARRNDRNLRDSNGDFIANGTRLTVNTIMPDGAAQATVESTGATVTLDRDYLAESTELGYATTAHRSQGVTVDTSHSVVGEGLSRELFYVSMTRGKQANHAYVQMQGNDDAHSVAEWDTPGDGAVSLHETNAAATPVEALTPVLKRATAEKTAHEVQDAEYGWAHDLGRMVHEHTYLQWASRSTRTQEWVQDTYPPDTAERIITDDDWQRLVATDPAITHHADIDPEADTLSAIVSRCEAEETSGTGPAGMLSSLTPHTESQQQIVSDIESQIDSELAVRVQQVRNERPEWADSMLDRYVDHPEAQRQALESVVMWRAISNQTEAETMLGKEPTQQDHLRRYWERAQHSLREADRAIDPESVIDLPEPFTVDQMPARPKAETEVWQSILAAWEDSQHQHQQQQIAQTQSEPVQAPRRGPEVS